MAKRRKKPREEDFIDGIFNYCDRWCERCPFTRRCRTFAMGQEFEQRMAREQAEADQFWATMNNVLGDAVEEIKKQAEALAPEPEPEQWDDDLEELKKRQKDEDRFVRRHIVSKRADVYRRAVGRWFKAHPAYRKRHEDGTPFGDAIDVIAWYHMFIGAKLARALRLRTLVERHFPDARKFHRPGFDDVPEAST